MRWYSQRTVSCDNKGHSWYRQLLNSYLERFILKLQLGHCKRERWLGNISQFWVLSLANAGFRVNLVFSAFLCIGLLHCVLWITPPLRLCFRLAVWYRLRCASQCTLCVYTVSIPSFVTLNSTFIYTLYLKQREKLRVMGKKTSWPVLRLTVSNTRVRTGT